MSHDHEPGSGDCLEVFARLSEYIDGELAPRMYDEVCGHMENCAPCQKFVETLRRTVEFLGNIGRPSPAGEVEQATREAYARLRRELGLGN